MRLISLNTVRKTATVVLMTGNTINGVEKKKTVRNNNRIDNSNKEHLIQNNFFMANN